MAQPQLDDEIASIRAEISSLRQHRALLLHTLLSSPSTEATLSAALANTSRLRPAEKARLELAAKRAQRARNAAVTNAYRASTGITAFRVKDPDPNSVDGGRVLGVRIEVSEGGGRMCRPYFVMLRRVERRGRVGGAEAGEEEEEGEGTEQQQQQQQQQQDVVDTQLKVHKHTIPPFIPLGELARKYLPSPSASDSPSSDTNPGARPGKQNLHAFARALRSHLQAYHTRLSAIEDLRATIASSGGAYGIEELETLGADAREVQLLDNEGAIVRFWVGVPPNTLDDGRRSGEKRAVVERVVVRTVEGEGAGAGRRFRHIERAIMGGDRSVGGVLERMRGPE